MPLGKDVITTGHANPRSNQPFHPSLTHDIHVLVKPRLCKTCRRLISEALMLQVIPAHRCLVLLTKQLYQRSCMFSERSVKPISCRWPRHGYRVSARPKRQAATPMKLTSAASLLWMKHVMSAIKPCVAFTRLALSIICSEVRVLSARRSSQTSRVSPRILLPAARSNTLSHIMQSFSA